MDENLYQFKKYNITSAYVRITNTRSATITSKFLSIWMDSPSSALDLWHCGKVILESTPTPHELQLYTSFKTFIGNQNCPCSKLLINLLINFLVFEKILVNKIQP